MATVHTCLALCSLWVTHQVVVLTRLSMRLTKESTPPPSSWRLLLAHRLTVQLGDIGYGCTDTQAHQGYGVRDVSHKPQCAHIHARQGPHFLVFAQFFSCSSCQGPYLFGLCFNGCWCQGSQTAELPELQSVYVTTGSLFFVCFVLFVCYGATPGNVQDLLWP